MFKAFATGAAALLLSIGAATAEDKKKADKPFDDAEFVKMAASGGMLEVELGKVAAEKGASDGVKKFGQKMQADHSKANKELMAVAKAAGMTVPEKLMDEHQKTLDKLSKLSGAEFDTAYIDCMIKDHEEDVADFKKASEEAKNADLKSFAKKTLPTLEEHEKMIKAMKK